MEKSETTPAVLEYQPLKSWRERAWAKGITRTPVWLIALALLVPVWAFDKFDFAYLLHDKRDLVDSPCIPFAYIAAFFLPGAIRRLAGRQTLIMFVLSAAGCSWIVFSRHWMFLRVTPVTFGLSTAIYVTIIYLAERQFTESICRASLTEVLLAALGVASGITVALCYIEYMDLRVSFPRLSGASAVSWDSLLYAPIVALFAWFVGPLVVHHEPSRRRFGGIMSATVWTVAIAFYFLFFLTLIYPMAIDSLRTGRPFSKRMAVATLKSRSDTASREALWNALETATPSDWDNGFGQDLIAALASQSPARTALEISVLLQQKPSSRLANASANLLADQKEYDAVPVLTRYMLVGPDTGCGRALEKMKVPIAGMAIFIRAVALYELDHPSAVIDDFALDKESRHELQDVFGADAGPTYLDWTTFFDKHYDAVPTPLMPYQAAETRKVYNACMRYYSAKSRLDAAAAASFSERISATGEPKLIGVSQQLARLTKSNLHPTTDDIYRIVFDHDDTKTVAAILGTVRHEFLVDPPNWNVVGTAGLQREVDDYVKRADALLSSHQAATTKRSKSS